MKIWNVGDTIARCFNELNSGNLDAIKNNFYFSASCSNLHKKQTWFWDLSSQLNDRIDLDTRYQLWCQTSKKEAQ